jgi:PAS domain S-box-containing protein
MGRTAHFLKTQGLRCERPVSVENQAVVLNAVPLLVLAALNLAVCAALVPSYWRERKRAADVDVATALMFPVVGIAAGIIGVLIAITREPLGGHIWLGLLAIATAYAPPLVFFARWADRSLLLVGARRAREAEQRGSTHERQLEAVARLSTSLATTEDAGQIGRLVLGETVPLLGFDFGAVAVVDNERRRARLVSGLDVDGVPDWLEGFELDLDAEPSGIATAVNERTAFTVYDAGSSARVHKRLVELTGLRSICFVPMLGAEDVSGVLVLGSRSTRVFEREELELLQGLASEAGLALGRLKSANALAAALERERLISSITTHLRSELDLDTVLNVTVRDVAEALDLMRCFVRLDGPVAAEWDGPGVEKLAGRSRALPVTTLAEREGRTISVANIAEATNIDPVGRDVLLSLGTAAALGTPITAGGQAIGVLGLHRAQAGAWTFHEIAVAEAVAREAGVAIHVAQLLDENRRRIAEQSALLEASQALASELQFDAVMQRLVDEVANLLGADAADCWILEDGGRRLICRAVRGLVEAEVGRMIRPEGTLGEAIESRRPVLKRDFATTEYPPPGPAYARFAETLNAPIAAGGEVRGVLRVCALEPGSFREQDIKLLDAFARLAAIALRNAEAYEDSIRRARVQQGFFRIASVLGEPLSAAATLDAVAQAASEALGGDAAAVLRPAGAELVLAGEHQLRQSVRDLLHAGTSIDSLAAAAAEHRVLASPRLADDDRFDAKWRDVVAEADNRALLAVPVAQPRGEGGGLVVVFFAEERTFADEDLELARQVATAARAALERSELYELERRSRALAQQLAHTGRELTTQLDPGAVLDEVVRQAPRLLGADAASIRLLEGGDLALVAATGRGAERVLDSREPSTAWMAGDIVQSRNPATIVDVRADSRSVDADPMIAAGTYGAYAGVPMIGPDGGVRGILAVMSARPREWRREEIEALQALAGNAAAALANAELYQRVAIEKERSDAILANVADGIVAVDREGAVVLWNAAAERITGVPASEAQGQSPEQALGRPLSSGTRRALPGRLVPIKRGSEEVWLSLTEAVMYDPAGAVSGRIFAFRDISDERVVEQMKSEFVSTVSHELRTPLTSIYGFAETMLREDVDFGEEERRTFLRYIASESERLTTIVDTLLSVARLDAGDMPVQLEPTDVSSVVTEAVRTIETTHGDNGHRFVAEVPEAPLAADADRDKLRQVLAILLENAARYSPDGGTVLVAARHADGVVEVRVEDEGIGIPASERERIFRKFSRVEGAGASVGAGRTGLGLFIAEGLVNAMGGRIWVDSTEGEGSTFVFELPATRTES